MSFRRRGWDLPAGRPAPHPARSSSSPSCSRPHQHNGGIVVVWPDRIIDESQEKRWAGAGRGKARQTQSFLQRMRAGMIYLKYSCHVDGAAPFWPVRVFSLHSAPPLLCELRLNLFRARKTRETSEHAALGRCCKPLSGFLFK